MRQPGKRIAGALLTLVLVLGMIPGTVRTAEAESDPSTGGNTNTGGDTGSGDNSGTDGNTSTGGGSSSGESEHWGPLL